MDQIFRRIGAVVAIALALSACSQLSSPRPVASSSIPTDTSTSFTGTGPFVYRIGVLDGLTTDNFWAFQGQDTTVWNAYILGPTKPSLYAPHPVTGALQPELAAGHVEPVEADGTWTVTVDLNPGMNWSDGQPVTAQDMVFTFDTVRRLDLAGAWAEVFPDTIAGLEALDQRTLQIVFTSRPTLAVWPHAVGLAPVMPAHVWEARLQSVTSASDLYSLAGAGDVGGGPLALDMIGDDLVVTVANPGYPLAGAPDRVEYHVFESEASAIEALNESRIDTVLSPKGFDPTHLRLLSDDQVTVHENRANGVRYLGFNLDRQPMADPAFRKALALLLEREIDTYVTEDNILWFDPAAHELIAAPYKGSREARFEAAIRGLRDAGYSWDSEPSADGTKGIGLTINGAAPAPLTILTPGPAWDPTRPEYAAEVAGVLESLGFTATPVATDFDTVVDLAFAPERGHDMYLLGWTLGNPSLPGYYRLLFAPDGEMNSTGYSSGAFLDQLERYENAYTTDEARRALWAMETILADDLPYLLLYGSSITEAYRADRVKFLYDDALGGLQGRLGGIGDVSPIGGS